MLRLDLRYLNKTSKSHFIAYIVKLNFKLRIQKLQYRTRESQPQMKNSMKNFKSVVGPVALTVLRNLTLERWISNFEWSHHMAITWYTFQGFLNWNAPVIDAILLPTMDSTPWRSISKSSQSLKNSQYVEESDLLENIILTLSIAQLIGFLIGSRLFLAT